MVRIRSDVAAGLAALLMWLIVPAPTRAAQGVSLAWSHCLSEGTGVQNMQFACNTNSGSDRMVGSFQLANAMNLVIGSEIVLQLSSASPALPAWWQFVNVGSCRSTSLIANGFADPADISCPDWSGDVKFLGLGTYCTSSGPCVDRPSAANQARVKLVDAVQQEFATTLAGGQEYFSFNLILQRAKTVGTGACEGCETPVCIVFNSIDVVAAGNVEHRKLTTASVPGGNYVTWQGGGGTNCPAATPTRNSTWGSVKSLYR